MFVVWALVTSYTRICRVVAPSPTASIAGKAHDKMVEAGVRIAFACICHASSSDWFQVVVLFSLSLIVIVITSIAAQHFGGTHVVLTVFHEPQGRLHAPILGCSRHLRALRFLDGKSVFSTFLPWDRPSLRVSSRVHCIAPFTVTSPHILARLRHCTWPSTAGRKRWLFADLESCWKDGFYFRSLKRSPMERHSLSPMEW